MRRAMTKPRWFVLASAAIGLAAAASVPNVFELPEADRQRLSQYFGDAITVKAIEAKPIEDPRAYLSPKDGAQWTYQVTSGKRRGQSVTATMRSESADGGSPTWWFDAGDESVVRLLWDEDGTVMPVTRSKINKVISTYEPPEPLLSRSLAPGESRKLTLHVSVSNVDDPDQVAHTGKLELTYTYIGAFKVTVPAGTFETVLVRWLYDGNVGPASVKDHQYWFLAKGRGVVAMIQKTDVSAFLVFQEHERYAAVLAK
ncbi:MAG: hypothetical protein KDA22_06935 [Phycisphaerales bacterium]|nr:hypothetical protein [Phycisphaerales bacterium]